MSVRKCLNPVTVSYKQPRGRMWEIYKDIKLLHKWHHYPEIYDELFAGYLDRPIKILEIGVYNGGSLQMWERYFHPDSLVVGIDIENQVKAELRDNTEVRIGDQGSAEFLDEIVEEFGQFDIIIDDGSHLTADQRDSFIRLFKTGLADEGLYVVEDTHTSYLAPFVNSRRTFIGTCQEIVDLMHAEYWNRDSFEEFSIGNEDREDTVMEYYEAWVYSVQFFDSMVAFKKRLKGHQTSDVVFKA